MGNTYPMIVVTKALTRNIGSFVHHPVLPSKGKDVKNIAIFVSKMMTIQNPWSKVVT